MRPQRRALLEHDGVHPHDPVVEQVGLYDAAAVDGGALLQGDEVGLGQPVRLTPDTAADLGAQRPQPQIHHRRAAGGAGEPRRRPPFRRTCPTPRCATRTTTTADARRPGCGRPQPISRSRRWRPRRRRRPAAPRRCRASPTDHPNSIDQRTAVRTSTADPDRERDDHRHQPARLHQAAHHLQPRRRMECAQRVGGGGLAAQPDRRAAQPRRPGLGLVRRRADSTATSPSSGTRRPGWVMPELPRNARLPIVALATWIQPPPSS